MQVVLLTTDLMLTSAAQGVVRRHGAALTTVGKVAEAAQACSESQATVLAVDLRNAATSLDTLVADVRDACAEAPLVFGFGPHVHEHVLATARDAGFDEVATRGEFERRLDEILSRLAS